MPRVGDIATIRSKNAGPFTLTIDLFCHDDAGYRTLDRQLTRKRVARLLQCRAEGVGKYLLPEIRVLKFSMRRPYVQGSREDREMHGAQYACLLAELEVSD